MVFGGSFVILTRSAGIVVRLDLLWSPASRGINDICAKNQSDERNDDIQSRHDDSLTTYLWEHGSGYLAMDK
jgi:hypothetical protein